MSGFFEPYRWNPVLVGGEDLRASFAVDGADPVLKLRVGGRDWPVASGGGVAEVVVPASFVADGDSVALLVDSGGDVWEAVAAGRVSVQEV